MSRANGPAAGRFAIAVHGGAGVIRRRDLTTERADACHGALRSALAAGHDVLGSGGTAMDAVTAAVSLLEDIPLFNAGRGSVFTRDGGHELDASVMNGADLAAGAVAAVRTIRNPVLAARAVLEKTRNVMLVAEGAEKLALDEGLETVDPSWFSTEQRRLEWERVREAEDAGATIRPEERSLGTVGAVALDTAGNVAAATSTGGLTNKPPGRIGDSPVIGAGTYAENGVCAVSATGDGEYFMRAVAAHRVAALVRDGGLALEEAARRVVHQVLAELGGIGGLIAVDGRGIPVLQHNSPGMYRGMIDHTGTTRTAIFADESVSA